MSQPDLNPHESSIQRPLPPDTLAGYVLSLGDAVSEPATVSPRHVAEPLVHVSTMDDPDAYRKLRDANRGVLPTDTSGLDRKETSHYPAVRRAADLILTKGYDPKEYYKPVQPGDDKCETEDDKSQRFEKEAAERRRVGIERRTRLGRTSFGWLHTRIDDGVQPF